MTLSDDDGGCCSDGDGALFDSSDDEFADVVHVAAALSRRHRRVQQSSESQLLKATDAEPTNDATDDDGGRDVGDEEEDEDLGVTVAVTLLVVCLLAFLGFVGYQVATSESYFAERPLPPRAQTRAKHVQVHVGLAQLYLGEKLEVEVERRLVCEHCAGTGMDFRAGVHACHQCDGTGVQTFVQQIGPIKQHIRSACQTCSGRGHVATSKCGACRGRGLRAETAKIAVEIERGMRHGDEIVVAREGDQSPKTLPGDLVVHLSMTPHPIFTRRGHDLELQLEITLLEALVGFSRDVAHLDNHTIRLERDGVSPPDAVWTVPNEGMPIRGKRRAAGNLLVRFAVAYPPELDTSAREAVAAILSD